MPSWKAGRPALSGRESPPGVAQPRLAHARLEAHCGAVGHTPPSRLTLGDGQGARRRPLPLAPALRRRRRQRRRPLPPRRSPCPEGIWGKNGMEGKKRRNKQADFHCFRSLVSTRWLVSTRQRPLVPPASPYPAGRCWRRSSRGRGRGTRRRAPGRRWQQRSPSRSPWSSGRRPSRSPRPLHRW